MILYVQMMKFNSELRDNKIWLKYKIWYFLKISGLFKSAIVYTRTIIGSVCKDAEIKIFIAFYSYKKLFVYSLLIYWLNDLCKIKKHIKLPKAQKLFYQKLAH